MSNKKRVKNKKTQLISTNRKVVTVFSGKERLDVFLSTILNINLVINYYARH